MRKINYIVVHCTATPQNTTIESIMNYWRNTNNWKSPGYHYIIPKDGQIVRLLADEEVSNGVAGYNSQSINVAYIGGVDAQGKPADSRTEAQKKALEGILTRLKISYPDAVIQGHRDFPGVSKACPSFDAKNEYKDL